MGNRYLKSGTAGTASPYESDVTAAVALATLIAIPPAVDEVIWVSTAHTESPNALTYTAPASATPIAPQRMLAVTDFDAAPSTLASKAVSIFPANTTTVAYNGHWYIHGFTWNLRYGQTGQSFATFGTSTVPHSINLVDCSVSSGGAAGTPSIVTFGPSAATANDDTHFSVNNFLYQTSTAACILSLRHGTFHINNMTMGGTLAPTTVFSFGAGHMATLTLENSDLSGSTWTNLFSATASALFKATVRNCKFPSGWSPFSGTIGLGCEIDIDNADNGNTNYIHRRYRYAGSVREETTIYATTGGASDGTTPMSWKMETLATASIFEPLYSEWVHLWVDDVATAIAPSVQVLVSGDGAAALTDAEVWVECDAMTTASTPLGTRRTDRVTQVIDTPANQAAGSTAWTGDGYTTERTHTLAVASFTPTKKGFIRCRVALAKPSTIIYVNPVVA